MVEPFIIGWNQVCTHCGLSCLLSQLSVPSQQLSSYFCKPPIQKEEVAKVREGDPPPPPPNFCVIVLEPSKSASHVASDR